MSNAVFLEYRYNPEINSASLLINRLVSMGFSMRSKHAVSEVEVWTQDRGIIIVKPDHTFSEEGQIMGIGCVCSGHPMDTVDNVFLDEDTDFYVREADNGFRFYFTETDSLTHLYKPTSNVKMATSGINAFTGIVLNTTNADMLQVLGKIAEKIEHVDKYTKYIFENKFTVFSKSSTGPDTGVELIISETVDVFNTTSFMLTRGVDTLQFDNSDLVDFGELTHKIVGYNCKAFGTKDSYTIENYIPKLDFNVDLVFRSRKRYIKIKEETLDYYETSAS
jgi:hypothetical protein|tara:strand:- start:1030 stop:1863 length:834 start_codon:yes stop_codon:yes gene_type:complete